MEIKNLTPESDLKAFKALRIEAVLDAPESFGESSSEVMHRDENSFAYNLSDHDKGDFVTGAFDQNKLVGVVGFYREASEKSNHKGTIWGLYISPDYRGRGLSKSLLGGAIEVVKTQCEVKQLRLTVVTTNAVALRLYESFGFEIYGTELQSLSLGGVLFDEHYMQLLL